MYVSKPPSSATSYFPKRLFPLYIVYFKTARTEVGFGTTFPWKTMSTFEALPVIPRNVSLNACLVILICTLLFSRWLSSTRHLKLPPGPRPDPFIGNLRQMSLSNQEQRFAEWGRIFGTVVSTCRCFTLNLKPSILRRCCILQSIWTPHDRVEHFGSRSGFNGETQLQLLLSPPFRPHSRNVILLAPSRTPVRHH